MMSKLKTLGILGGMGPEATLLFYQKIIQNIHAKKDQEHIPTLIYSNTQILDRTECILQGNHEPIIRQLQNSAKILERGGADFIVIPCNTSHYYLNEIKTSVKITVLNMLGETAKSISKEQRREKKAGLLATTGTLSTKIYHREFKKFGIKIVTPGKENQKKVMKAIYSIKAKGPAKKSQKLIGEVMQRLRKKGAKIIILGCTELPLLFQEGKENVVDPMDILAKVSIEKAGGKLK